MCVIVARALVAMHRVLCAFTLHRWYYKGSSHGGRPTFRICMHCGKRQTWHYGLARERGIIRWIDYGNANDK